MPKLKYDVTFSDGSTDDRVSTSGRVYSHAVLISGVVTRHGWVNDVETTSIEPFREVRYAGRLDLAQKVAAEVAKKSWYKGCTAEIVPVTPIEIKPRGAK